MNTQKRPMRDFHYPFGPVSGPCAECGKNLGAYWNKLINRNTGELYCPGRCAEIARALFLVDNGMHDYSDG